MKLSTRSTYGVRLMANLAQKWGGGPALLKEVAAEEEISEKYLSQIVIPLRSAGLLRSIRGARGGYVLGARPSEITLRQIVEVLEGGLDFVDEEAPTRPTHRVFQEIWSQMSQEMSRFLGSITLEEVIQRAVERGTSSVMYHI